MVEKGIGKILEKISERKTVIRCNKKDFIERLIQRIRKAGGDLLVREENYFEFFTPYTGLHWDQYSAGIEGIFRGKISINELENQHCEITASFNFKTNLQFSLIGPVVFEVLLLIGLFFMFWFSSGSILWFLFLGGCSLLIGAIGFILMTPLMVLWWSFRAIRSLKVINDPDGIAPLF